MERSTLIDMLIFMRQNMLLPVPVKTIDYMVLYVGTLGKVFSGVDPTLDFTPYKISYHAFVHMVSPAVHSTTLKTVVKEP